MTTSCRLRMVPAGLALPVRSVTEFHQFEYLVDPVERHSLEDRQRARVRTRDAVAAAAPAVLEVLRVVASRRSGGGDPA